MPEPTPGKKFWERIGKGVAQGWEKAKEVSTRVGEIAVLKLDLKKARDRLEGAYTQLGKAAANRLIERAEGSVDATDAPIKALLDDVAAARSQVADLEKKLAESD